MSIVVKRLCRKLPTTIITAITINSYLALIWSSRQQVYPRMAREVWAMKVEQSKYLRLSELMIFHWLKMNIN